MTDTNRNINVKIPDTGRNVIADRNLQIILAVTFLSVMGVSGITPALPVIAEELNIPKESIGIIIAAFSIPSVLMAPIIGILSDRFGRKKFLVPALFLFGLAGGLCAFVPSLKGLLFLRFLQGLGASGLSTLNVTIIGDLYDGSQRTQALGYNASAIAIGLGLFPVIGGTLAMAGWNYPFALPFIAILVGMWALFSLKNPENRGSQSFVDYLSSSLTNLFKLRVLATFAAGLATFIILYGGFFTYFPILVEEKFGSSSMTIGIIMATMSAATVVTATQLSRIVKRFTEHQLVKRASVLYGFGLLAMPFVPETWMYIVPLAAFGAAHGVNLPCIQTLVAKFAPAENRAAFMSVNNMVFRLGQTVGPLIMGAAYGLWGINSVFYACAVLCLALYLFAVIISSHSTSAGPEYR